MLIIIYAGGMYRRALNGLIHFGAFPHTWSDKRAYIIAVQPARQAGRNIMAAAVDSMLHQSS